VFWSDKKFGKMYRKVAFCQNKWSLENGFCIEKLKKIIMVGFGKGLTALGARST
jgi:hypothetical protein